jgi:transcriptional regulator with XRE-family HTH domain
MIEPLFDCDLCGGPVELVAVPGRTREFRTGVVLEVPATFPIATCRDCGETYLTTEEAERLEAALSNQLAADCQKLVATIHDRTGFTQKQVEAVCGVTPTYLSHVLAGRKQPSATLLRLLECFALHPEEARRQQRGETWMAAMAAATLQAPSGENATPTVSVTPLNEQSEPTRLALVLPFRAPSEASKDVRVQVSNDVVQVPYWGSACPAR